MILTVQKYKENRLSFSAHNKNREELKEELKKKPMLMKNTFSNRTEMSLYKFIDAITMYPARGLKGSRNSNFYEFLTMGIIPYLTGSIMLMAVFNGAKNFFGPDAKASANKLGTKMALGVVFYGLAKNISKGFVTKPVKWFTGVDTEEPYMELKYKLPEYKNDTDITSVEYHKVFESLEFPRWDVKYGDESKGQSRNIWFDKIAKKIGLGTGLKDSDQDVKPRVKEIVAKTNLAKSISSYLWAAVGVGLAIQNTWDEFFNMATWKVWKGKKFLKTCDKFLNCLGDSVIQFYKGIPGKGFFEKNSGKMLLASAALTTAIGIANVLNSNQKPSKVDSANVIEKDRTYVVS